MTPNASSRREFLRVSAAAAAVWSWCASGSAPGGGMGPQEKRPLEKRKFGKTDMNVTVLASAAPRSATRRPARTVPAAERRPQRGLNV